MKKKGFKVLSLILSLVMVFSLLSACSSGKSDKKEASASTPKSADGTKADKVYEYTWLSMNAPLAEGSWGQKYFEQKFNVKTKIIRVDVSRWAEQVSVLLATGDIPDLIWCNNIFEVGNYAKQAVLAEVKIDDIKKNMPKYYEMVMKNDPKLLAHSIMNKTNIVRAKLNANGKYPYPAAVRADWLKNVGISKIPETIQELEDAFLKFRNNDPDKNGKKDTYAISMGSDYPKSEVWFQSIFGAYGVNPFLWKENSGKLEFGFTAPEFKEALKLLQKWYKAEIIDPEFVTDKARNSSKDISQKFSMGKLGYMENITFDDHQWDNDGHLNAKWVANNPEWKDFFDKNKDNLDKLYATKNFTTFDTSVPQPVYVNLPPVKGPNGKSGYLRDGFQNEYLAFGKQLEKDKGKYDRLLQILEVLAIDEKTYVEAHFGPEGKAWKNDSKGVKVWNPDWSKDPDYHPQWQKTGTGKFYEPMYWTNPDFLFVVGGTRAEQRYKSCGDIFAKFPAYENALKVVLPSSAETRELTTTVVKDFIIKAITTDMNIDKEFDASVSNWMKKGGEKLTKEANDWYATIK